MDNVATRQSIVLVDNAQTSRVCMIIGENQGADKSGDTTGNAVVSSLYPTGHPVNVTQTGSFLAVMVYLVSVLV